MVTRITARIKGQELSSLDGRPVEYVGVNTCIAVWGQGFFGRDVTIIGFQVEFDGRFTRDIDPPTGPIRIRRDADISLQVTYRHEPGAH